MSTALLLIFQSAQSNSIKAIFLSPIESIKYNQKYPPYYAPQSRYMIQNIDTFMSNNCLDPRVSYLYATRNKLFKFLQKIKEDKFVTEASKFHQKPRQQKQIEELKKSLRKVNDSHNSDQRFPKQKQSPHKNSIQNRKSQKERCLIQIQEHENEQNASYVQRSAGRSGFQQKRRQSPQRQKLQSRSYAIQNHLKGKQDSKQKLNIIINQPQNKPKQTSTKAVTPVKSSKKVQSFMPRKTQLKQRQQQPHQKILVQQSYKKYKLSQEAMKNTSQQQKQQQSISLNSNKRRQNNGLKALNQSYQNSKFNESSSYRNVKGETKRESQQFEVVQKTSSIKNLTNLIFKIKMTKDEYNQFKRIKQENSVNFRV